VIKQSKELTVQFNYHIELREDRHHYSVPWQLKGKRVKGQRGQVFIPDRFRPSVKNEDLTPWFSLTLIAEKL